MKDKTFQEVFGTNFLENWDHISTARKPIIAVVNGYAVSLAFKAVDGKGSVS